MAKVYVGDLPFSATEGKLRELFSRHGTFESVSLPMEPRRPDHQLVAVIAANTGLSLNDMWDEQRLRGASKLTASPG